MSEVKRSQKSPHELINKGYSDEEIQHIYELARLSLDNGKIREAETLLLGILEVAPEFAEGWLALSYVNVCNKRYNEAIFTSRQALRIKPDFPEAMLMLIANLLTANDVNTAGTYLGEFGELVDSGQINHPKLTRFYRAQLARYQAR